MDFINNNLTLVENHAAEKLSIAMNHNDISIVENMSRDEIDALKKYLNDFKTAEILKCFSEIDYVIFLDTRKFFFDALEKLGKI